MSNISKTILLSFLAFAGLVSCNAKQTNETETSTENNQKSKIKMNTDKNKTLIIYFSHPGENYSVGNIKVGNTKIIADYIKDYIGCESFEVVAEKNYDMPYNQLTELAKQEQETQEKPAFKGEIKNFDQYETIFIGTPIWWGTFPQVMFTFFDKYDMNGKTIIPFSTHEGSGLGQIVTDLKSQYPKADIKEGLAIQGHKAKDSKDKVEKWVKSFGF